MKKKHEFGKCISSQFHIGYNIIRLIWLASVNRVLFVSKAKWNSNFNLLKLITKLKRDFRSTWIPQQSGFIQKNCLYEYNKILSMVVASIWFHITWFSIEII